VAWAPEHRPAARYGVVREKEPKPLTEIRFLASLRF